MIDMNAVYMWLVRGFDGVINLTRKMMQEGMIPGPAPIEHCQEMVRQLNALIHDMKEMSGTK